MPQASDSGPVLVWVLTGQPWASLCRASLAVVPPGPGLPVRSGHPPPTKHAVARTGLPPRPRRSAAGPAVRPTPRATPADATSPARYLRAPIGRPRTGAPPTRPFLAVVPSTGWPVCLRAVSHQPRNHVRSSRCRPELSAVRRSLPKSLKTRLALTCKGSRSGAVTTFFTGSRPPAPGTARGRRRRQCSARSRGNSRRDPGPIAAARPPPAPGITRGRPRTPDTAQRVGQPRPAQRSAVAVWGVTVAPAPFHRGQLALKLLSPPPLSGLLVIAADQPEHFGPDRWIAGSPSARPARAALSVNHSSKVIRPSSNTFSRTKRYRVSLTGVYRYSPRRVCELRGRVVRAIYASAAIMGLPGQSVD